MSKRRKRPVDRFARLPVAVLQSEAWRTLKHSARSTLTVLAAQFHGQLHDGTIVNGVSVITRKLCAEFGIVHDSATRDAGELERRGLIVRTFRSKYRGAAPQAHRLASEYALGWLPVTHRNRDLLDRPEPAPNGWEKWTAGVFDADEASAERPISADEASADDPQICRRGVGETPTSADENPDHLRFWEGPRGRTAVVDAADRTPEDTTAAPTAASGSS